MFAKTALLTGAAVVMLSAAPALAQDAMTPQTPPSSQAPMPSPSTAPAPGTMQIQPGSDVKGSDGAILGKLEGVHTVNGAQELKVRGTDGVLRGVPLTGLKQDGTGVAVAWTTPEYQAAPALDEPAPAADPAASPTGDPMNPATATPDATTPDATPDATTPDTTGATPPTA